jgi:ubiquinone/menaquinone biosynthesis C-methylase UbiE
LIDLYADWAQVYDWFYPDRDSESLFWAQRAAAHGQCVLDLMCGTAEVSLGLARRGLKVLAVDRSPAMLAVASTRLSAAADHPARSLELAQGDACAIPASGEQVDFVLVGGGGSFNHLGDEKASQALAEMNRVLRPGGGLGLELANPYLLVEIDPQRTFGPLRCPPPGERLERSVEMRHDPATGAAYIHQVTRYERAERRVEFEESFSLQLWTPQEIAGKLEKVGFRELAFYGGYELEPFGKWSTDLLVLATSQGTQ